MITKKQKLKITEDWKELFPTLGVYKPMHLLNRIGPLVVGIYLEENSAKDSYQPVFHVHNLLKKFPVVSLELNNTILNHSIRYEQHPNVYNQYINSFKEKILIPFEGAITLDRILKGYRQYLLKPTYPHQQSVYEDMVLLSSWCGDQKAVTDTINLARKNMRKWPNYIIERMNGIDDYLLKLKSKSENLDQMKSNYENQIQSLKLEDLPVRNLLI